MENNQIYTFLYIFQVSAEIFTNIHCFTFQAQTFVKK